MTATAALAARCLKKLAAAGLLDDDACAELAPDLVGRGKGTALEVLRLLRDVGRRRPDLVPVVGPTVSQALEHPHGDVQRAAVTLLRDLGVPEVVDDLADHLAPTVRRLADQEPVADLVPHEQPVPLPADLAPAGLHVPDGAELVEAVAALLEDAEEPMAVEAALAGLARADDPALLAPLTRRARTLLKRPGFATEHELRATMATLVLLSCRTDDAAAAPLPGPATSLGAAPAMDPVRLLRARAVHVAAVVGGRAPAGPLLATPTDSDGWVDPRSFLRALGSADQPHPADLLGGLLRLEEDGRAQALAAVRARGGDAVAAVDQAQAAAFHGSLEIGFRTYRYTGPQGEQTGRHIEFAVRADGGSSTTTRNGLARDGSRASPGPTWARWAATVHPHDTEPVFSMLCLHVLEALDYWEVDHTIPRALLALARHPGRVGPLGAVTAAAGLAAQDGSHRVLGVDAAAALAARGTLGPQALAAAMTTIAPATRLPRWATSLDQLAQAVGSGYVIEVLTDLLPQLPRDGRGLVKLLDVLAEESTRVRRPVIDPALLGYLRSFTGSSGAAAAARRALAVT